MAYPKEIKQILKNIPKEHHRDIQKIIDFYYKQGSLDVLELLKELGEKVDPANPNDYMVIHYNEADGG